MLHLGCPEDTLSSYCTGRHRKPCHIQKTHSWSCRCWPEINTGSDMIRMRVGNSSSVSATSHKDPRVQGLRVGSPGAPIRPSLQPPSSPSPGPGSWKVSCSPRSAREFHSKPTLHKGHPTRHIRAVTEAELFLKTHNFCSQYLRLRINDIRVRAVAQW